MIIKSLSTLDHSFRVNLIGKYITKKSLPWMYIAIIFPLIRVVSTTEHVVIALAHYWNATAVITAVIIIRALLVFTRTFCDIMNRDFIRSIFTILMAIAFVQTVYKITITTAKAHVIITYFYKKKNTYLYKYFHTIITKCNLPLVLYSRNTLHSVHRIRGVKIFKTLGLAHKPPKAKDFLHIDRDAI